MGRQLAARRLAGVIGAITSTCAQADMVAIAMHPLRGGDFLIVQLSDEQRPLIGPKDFICEREGRFMANINASSQRSYPSSIQYAAGCWAADGKAVHIRANRVSDDKPLTLTIPYKEFQTAPSFKAWQDYRERKP